MGWRIFCTCRCFIGWRNIKYKMNDILVDTGTDHFRSAIGNNCCIGAFVIILSRRKIYPDTQIQTETTIKS